ncbi:HAD-IB family phosphatase [Sinanaerobacter chloroacetimidivorans]|uniref:phosphoserine phosphatase n=1 Tax=Sinanaerobacter chloroacetimidivorans TaxID=2818044 RepID=A0A8J7W2Z7_9FIRM|nr:HAD-IB family phosphatase [Sinanaerobacter chloroacetimidivorans]MBR0599939.1 HAD-IB family phosphatase [Sinanaerobacter chloroacetimidivorans]
MYDKIIFVDFDGTITTEDTLDGAMRLFVSKEEYDKKYREMIQGSITLSEALHLVFDNTPSSRFSEMMEYIHKVSTRDGFAEFLDEMKALGIPVVVISGGLRQLLEVKIGKYKEWFLGMHYVDLDISGDNMRLVSEYDDGKEVLKKTEIMAQYDYQTAICIGDSYTDINMAAASDVVFARDILADYLKKEGKPFISWNDFYDIIEAIKGFN